MNIYCLIGGTIDITAHQVMEDRNVRELIKATGGNWGGTRADEEYMDFIMIKFIKYPCPFNSYNYHMVFLK